MNKILTSLLILTILSLLALSFFIPKWTDYYLYSSQLESKEMFRWLWNGYLTWDGRFMTIYAIIQCLIIKYLPHYQIILIYTITFIATSAILCQILFGSINARKLIVILLSLFYGFYSHISETVFWAVGGIYTLHLISALLFMYLIEKIGKQPYQNSFNNPYIIFFLSLIVGTSTHNLVPALLLYSIHTFAMSLSISLKKSKKQRELLIIAFSGMLLGLIWIIVAPGNFLRSSGLSNVNIDVVYLLKLFIGINLRFLKYSIIIIVSAFISALLLTSSKNQTSFRDFLKNNYIWLLMAGATVIPFVFVPSEASLRTTIFFMTFIYIFVFQLSQWMLIRLQINISEWSKDMVIAMIAIIHLSMIPFHYKDGFIAIKERQRIESEIISQKSRNVEIIKIEQPEIDIKSFTINYNKYRITNDPNHWINQQLSSYYNVKSIINISD